MPGCGRHAASASASAVVLAATLMLGVGAPASAGGSTARYASPHGIGAECSKAVPCAIDEAIDNAGADSTVLVEPGTYGSKTHPLASTLENTNAISVRGTSRTLRPIIYTSAPGGIDLSGGGELENIILRDVTHDADSVGIVIVDGYVAHVTVVTHGLFAIACRDPRVVLDSAFISAGKNGFAIVLDGSTAVSTETISGVTAEAPGRNGTGIEAAADEGSLGLSIFNSIVHGRTTDVTIGAFPDLASSVTLTNSDFATTALLGFGGTETLIPGTGDIKTAPRFVDSAADNFAEAPGSPTINTGGATVRSTATDVLGNPRVLGAAPDMGAFEFLQRATVGRLTVTGRAHHSLHLAVKVNPQGLSSHVVVVAHLGKHHVRSRVVSAGHGRTATTIHLSLHGLELGSTYTTHAVVTNKAGPAKSAARRVRTRT